MHPLAPLAEILVESALDGLPRSALPGAPQLPVPERSARRATVTRVSRRMLAVAAAAGRLRNPGPDAVAWRPARRHATAPCCQR